MSPDGRVEAACPAFLLPVRCEQTRGAPAARRRRGLTGSSDPGWLKDSAGHSGSQRFRTLPSISSCWADVYERRSLGDSRVRIPCVGSGNSPASLAICAWVCACVLVWCHIHREGTARGKVATSEKGSTEMVWFVYFLDCSAR